MHSWFCQSTVDYIMVRKGDEFKVHNVKVIPNQECVPKHKQSVMDMWFNTTKRRHKKFEPRVRVTRSGNLLFILVYNINRKETDCHQFSIFFKMTHTK